MILFDTNVVSAVRRRDRADANVLRWSDAQPAATLYVSAITIMELEIGILRLERRDVAQSSILRRWMEEQVLPTFEGRVLPVDTAVARRCAALHVPDPKPERDALIAATALVHGLTIATRNIPDFRYLGVKLVDPWADV